MLFDHLFVETFVLNLSIWHIDTILLAHFLRTASFYAKTAIARMTVGKVQAAPVKLIQKKNHLISL